MKIISKQQFRECVDSGKIIHLDNKDNYIINGKYFNMTINKNGEVELEQYEVFNEQ